MLGEMFDLDQTSPNIAKHDVRSPNKVCKGSNISPNMMLGQMLGEMLDRLHRPLELSINFQLGSNQGYCQANQVCLCHLSSRNLSQV